MSERTFIQGYPTTKNKDAKNEPINNSYVTSTENPSQKKRGMDVHITNQGLITVMNLLENINAQLCALNQHMKEITGEKYGND